MNATASANRTLDVLLESLCGELQLTRTQDARSRSHYQAVADWLAADGSPLRPFSPHIYPQGSQRLGTTTRPVRQSEFDLDAVCKLDIGPSRSPGGLYDLIWDRLAANETYRKMMRRKPRCIRLDYAGDFHLDIVPAVTDTEHGGNFILVPDLEADLSPRTPLRDGEGSWKSTNPIGYAEWFEDQCVEPWFSEGIQASAQVDPVPEPEAVHAKPALKRSVQLFKRWRDVEYESRMRLAPPSIILTTMSGNYYAGQQLCSDALCSILDATVAEVFSGTPLRPANPAHPDENICEKWDEVEGAYADFCEAVVEFRDRFERLQSTKGIDQLERELSELFGESPVRLAIKRFIDEQVTVPRNAGRLKVAPDTGRLTKAAATVAPVIAIPSNTFHGD